MLHDLPGFGLPARRPFESDDITVIIAVRLHAQNPWVLARIAALGDYYSPAPRLLLVDFGSTGTFRTQLVEAAQKAGIELCRVADEGVFSLAKARNCGAQAANSELLFFSDVDCFGERDLFARLAKFANDMAFEKRLDQVASLPVYHLGEDASAAFFSQPSSEQRSTALARTFANSVYGAPGSPADYVDPHSNFFLIRRDFFDYIGGFNESFRGHGSEDFEFFLRLSMYSLQFPVPDAPAQDAFAPQQEESYGPKPYFGFRRLLELMALPAQLAGLRIAHLHHPRGLDRSGWYENTDWSRTRFGEQVLPLMSSRIALLAYDWMPREKRALVLIRQPAHADMFFPLRLAGYRLTIANPDDADSLVHAHELLAASAVDAVAVFNPYMRSHAELAPLLSQARAQGIKSIIVERGALPESWYYASEMAYGDADYARDTGATRPHREDELELVDAYFTRLRAGGATLEANGDGAQTQARHRAVRAEFTKACLVPLQLPDDVAVTHFNEGFPAYDAFVSQLREAPAQHPDVLFLIKPHPLSKIPFEHAAPNVVVCSVEDNIHALIDLADAVICYNSGVGLLSLIHERRVVTLGNAFYNQPGFGRRAGDVEQALALAFDAQASDFLTRSLRPFLAWLLLDKYSFFRSESVLREVSGRSAHDYRRMLWYQLNLEGVHRVARRAALDQPVASHCYAAAQLGIGAQLSEQRNEWSDEGARKTGSARRKASFSNKLDKLLRDPKRFFADSRVPALRALAHVMPEGQTSPATAAQLDAFVQSSSRMVGRMRRAVSAARPRRRVRRRR